MKRLIALEPPLGANITKLLIAVDIDNTWTADPTGFAQIIELMKMRGHSFIFATGRDGWTDDMARMGLSDIPIVFCGREPKRKACSKKGYKPNIWIDDCPGTIEDSVFIAGDL